MGLQVQKNGIFYGKCLGYSTGIQMISTFSTGHGDKDSVVGISMEIGYDQLMDMDG